VNSRILRKAKITGPAMLCTGAHSSKDPESALRITMHVHQNGISECGIYTYEVAETKVTQVMDFARKHQHPLRCVMEKK
jgi:ATP-dependent Clp protease adaptor protein ClpS